MLLIVVAFIALVAQRWDLVPSMLWICVPMLITPFLWEIFRPLPLPILFNRRTREVYFDHDGELYHSPWDGIQALAGEFVMVGPHTGGMRNASLEILVRRLGEPDNALLVTLGLPMGKTLVMQKGFWEWLRAYMDNGPWFDENGQRSESDAFVKSMLAAHIKPTGFLAYQRQKIAEKKPRRAGITIRRAAILCCIWAICSSTPWTGCKSSPTTSPSDARATAGRRSSANGCNPMAQPHG